jgi:hypothetical protein
MSENSVPLQLLPAIGTVIAALIAAVFSFVNMTLSKEQKTSDFRQAWVDGLREDIAAFLSTARAFARANEDLDADSSDALDKSKVTDLRLAAAERFYKIRLRLNLEEPAHKILHEHLEAVIEKHNDHATDAGADTESILNAVALVAEHAAPVLKAEWDRVKRGEFPFRFARNFVAPATILGALLLIGILLTMPSHEKSGPIRTILPACFGLSS